MAGKGVQKVPIRGNCSSSLCTSQTGWSWGSRESTCFATKLDAVETTVANPTALDDDEYKRINKARERLARREIELRQIIEYANGETATLRVKLVKDLEILEILKEEIEKAGTGPLREQLELDFYNGTTTSLYLLRFRIHCLCRNFDKAEGASSEDEGEKRGCYEGVGRNFVE